MKKLAVLLGLVATISSYACPTKEQIQAKLEELAQYHHLKTQFRVEKVKDIHNSPFCEVIIQNSTFPNQLFPTVRYVTKDMKYLILGPVINLQTKQNLTRETMNKYDRVSEQYLQELQEYVAFSYYRGKSYFGKIPPAQRYIYLIVNPKCPFCYQRESLLQHWADKNDVEIRVIYNIFPSYPNSYQTAVGLYCNRKGWNSLLQAHNPYFSLPQCPEGQEFIQASTQITKGISLPTIINQYGKMFNGIPLATNLLNQLIEK